MAYPIMGPGANACHAQALKRSTGNAISSPHGRLPPAAQPLLQSYCGIFRVPASPCACTSQQRRIGIRGHQRLQPCRAGFGGFRGLASLLGGVNPDEQSAGGSGSDAGSTLRNFGANGLQSVANQALEASSSSSTTSTTTTNNNGSNGNGNGDPPPSPEGSDESSSAITGADDDTGAKDAWGLHSEDWDEDWDPSAVGRYDTNLGDFRDSRPIANETPRDKWIAPLLDLQAIREAFDPDQERTEDSIQVGAHAFDKVLSFQLF